MLFRGTILCYTAGYVLALAFELSFLANPKWRRRGVQPISGLRRRRGRKLLLQLIYVYEGFAAVIGSYFWTSKICECLKSHTIT